MIEIAVAVIYTVLVFFILREVLGDDDPFQSEE